jgi:hypothetical protein
MKRLIPIFILSAIFGLLLSCDSDSDTSIEGTWSANELLVMYEGGGFAEAPLPDSWKESLSLNKDGTYTYAWQKDGRSGSGSGTWVRENNTLTLTQNGREEQLDAKISGDTLILSTAVPGGTAQLSFGK